MSPKKTERQCRVFQAKLDMSIDWEKEKADYLQSDNCQECRFKNSSKCVLEYNHRFYLSTPDGRYIKVVNDNDKPQLGLTSDKAERLLLREFRVVEQLEQMLRDEYNIEAEIEMCISIDCRYDRIYMAKDWEFDPMYGKKGSHLMQDERDLGSEYRYYFGDDEIVDENMLDQFSESTWFETEG